MRRGRLVAVASGQLEARHPRPGFTERDMEAMWAAAAFATRTVLANPAVVNGASGIAALCVTGHGNGVYLVDADGGPVVGVVSSDTRTFALAERFAARDDAGRLAERLGQRVRPALTPLCLRWFDENEPAVSARTGRVLLCKDYVRYRLTDVFTSDPCDLSGSGLLNPATGAYDAELFAAMGLEAWLPKLPEVRRNSEVCGTVTAGAAAATGLAAGTPVVAGMMDMAATVVGSGVSDASRIAVVAGTWSIALVVVPEIRRDPYPVAQTIHRDGEAYLVAEGSPTAATNLAWLLRCVLDGENLSYERVNALVAALPPEDSRLVYLPYIHGGEGAPRAAFVGLGTECGRAHMLRALFEGVAFGVAGHVCDAVAVAGISPPTIRLSGGVARSPVWAQMIADVTGLPVEVADSPEVGALGCAICAAVAVGRHPGFAAAMAAMTRVATRHAPEPVRQAVYAAKLADFDAVRDRLAPYWRRAAPAATG